MAVVGDYEPVMVLIMVMGHTQKVMVYADIVFVLRHVHLTMQI